MNIGKKQSGFTLLELLVVISIVGLLTSIMFSTTRVSRTKASISRLQQDARVIHAQIDIARDTHNKSIQGIIGPCMFCSVDNGKNVNNEIKKFPWLKENIDKAWRDLGFLATPKDPWGTPYLIQIKEEDDYCIQPDQIYSAGPDGKINSYVTYSSKPPGVVTNGPRDDYVFSIAHYLC
jgi:prepilin-type N-terminal cleavage/methylation domain-containing protein